MLAYRSFDRFKPGASFRPWLLRIVVNEAHNVLRAELRLSGSDYAQSSSKTRLCPRPTQWPDKRIDTRITIVPTSGTAGNVKIGRLPGLWIEGTARGIFTLIGADGTVHKERFEVQQGALLWKQDGVALLLQGAGSQERETKLAAEASR